MKGASMHRTTTAVFIVTIAMACGPAGDRDPEPVVAVFDLDSANLFDVPFPSEVRRTADGRVDVSLFPNPRHIDMVAKLVDVIDEEMMGFGTSSAMYVRFTGPIDTGTLPPTPAMSREPSSSLQLVDVDPSSPYMGERVPVIWHYRQTVTDFWMPHTLAVLPVAGYALWPDTLYALVMTDDVESVDGLPVQRDAGFLAMVDDVADFGAAYSSAEAAHRTAMQSLSDRGMETERIVVAAVFRTTDPVEQTIALLDDVLDNVDPPEIIDLAMAEDLDGYTIYTGTYGPNPNYQYGFGEGLSPYETTGGWIVFDEWGDPVKDGDETMRVSITVPDGVVPVGGWPTVLYAHGTGGDYLSYTENGVAAVLAGMGIAVIGIDNAMNGARIPDGANADTLFFNIGNIRATRDNIRQAAVDVIQLERLVGLLTIDEETSVDGQLVGFSTANLAFMGHSQGGLNGALYLAMSDNVNGAVLSGAGGGLLYSLVYKTGPYNIRNLIGIVMGFTGSSEELDEEDFGIFHPTLNLAQMFYEPADGVNYARHWHLSPLPGVRAKSVLMTEGMDDSYAPPETIEALAAGGYMPPVQPVIEYVDGLTLKGLDPLVPPVSGNCAMSLATCGLVQYPVDPDYDGHFVAFHDEGAIEVWSTFLQALVAGDLPIIDTI